MRSLRISHEPAGGPRPGQGNSSKSLQVETRVMNIDARRRLWVASLAIPRPTRSAQLGRRSPPSVRLSQTCVTGVERSSMNPDTEPVYMTRTNQGTATIRADEFTHVSASLETKLSCYFYLVATLANV